MREDPELCSRGMDDAAANLNERVGLGWCAGVLVMVVYLRNGIYSKDMARTGTGQGVTRSLSQHQPWGYFRINQDVVPISMFNIAGVFVLLVRSSCRESVCVCGGNSLGLASLITHATDVWLRKKEKRRVLFKFLGKFSILWQNDALGFSGPCLLGDNLLDLVGYYTAETRWPS